MTISLKLPQMQVIVSYSQKDTSKTANKQENQNDRTSQQELDHWDLDLSPEKIDSSCLSLRESKVAK